VLVAAAGVGAGTAGIAAVLRPPTPRLSARVRPYTITARTALGHPVTPPTRLGAGTLPRLFGPAVRGALSRASRVLETRGDESLERALRQAGATHLTPEGLRVRQLASAVAFAVGAGVVVAVLLHAPLIVLAAAGAGFVYGAARVRRRLERVVIDRAARVRLELATVNQLLAMHVRTGAGVMQAVQRVVERSGGVVAGEMRDVLAWTRGGLDEGEAFRRAAELTPESSAARTYRLLAAGVERGVDLASGLLALSNDIRDARRTELHKHAVRRRAAMLVPTIAILAPIMLLFIAAPLPSIVLGHH
jgi:tight adherence protein C